MKKTLTAVALSSIVLTGCMANGEDYAADVYDASQVNTQQKPVIVKILAVMNAKVAVENKQGKQLAQVAGGLFGALVGGAVGYQSGHSAYGAAAGGSVGAVGGSLVKDKVLVPGVTITYRSHGKLLSSTQVGKKCQFKKGTALMITLKNKETRIQPNAECPVEKK